MVSGVGSTFKLWRRRTCLEPDTVRWLDEVAGKAVEGDLEYLQKVGRVFQAVTQ
jgi:hypothetical protein